MDWEYLKYGAKKYKPVLFHDRRNRPFIYNRIEE